MWSWPVGLLAVAARTEISSEKVNLWPAVPFTTADSTLGCHHPMGTEELNAMDHGGAGGIVGIGLSVTEGDSLAEGDSVAEGEGVSEAADGLSGTGGISLALGSLISCWRLGATTTGSGLVTGAACTDWDTIGFGLCSGCLRATAPTAAEPVMSTATAAAVTRSPVVTTEVVTAGAATALAASSWLGSINRRKS